MKPNIIFKIPPKLGSSETVAIDSEWTGMQPGKMHRPTGTFACLQIAQGNDVWFITDPKLVPQALKNIEKATWIFQHFMFDVYHLRRLAKIPERFVWDTMRLEQIHYSGWYETFSLQALARRHLGIYLEKSARDEFATATSLSPKLVNYAARDAVVTGEIQQKQKPIMDEDDLRVWNEVDLPAAWAILDMQGIMIDAPAWLELAKYHEKLYARLSKKLGFNPGSWQQVRAALENEGFKWERDFTSTNEESLTYLTNKGSKIAAKVLDAHHASKRAGTYGRNILELLEEGRLYPEYNLIGAETGRVIAAPIQQIPKEKLFREKFIAPKEQSLIQADYSMQEPTILAFLSQDEFLLDICRRGKDIHQAVADRLGVSRKIGKSIQLAQAYGQTAYGLSERLGISVEEAEHFTNDYFAQAPGVKAWQIQQQKAENYVTTIMGRKFWLNKRLISKGWKRNALNSPVQGSGADQLKMAIAKMRHEWPKKWGAFGLCGLIHDETLTYVDKRFAKDCKAFVKECMESVGTKMLDGLPIRADVKICRNWGDALEE